MDRSFGDLATSVLETCRRAKLKLATAESCTGGMIAAALTDIAGSSDVVERGFVTYSDEAKTELLGVPAATIAAHGAVSAQVAKAMAMGARARFAAALAVGITGIAGPDGGSAEKPVGLTYLGLADAASSEVRRFAFDGDRAANREAGTRAALEWLIERAEMAPRDAS